LQADNKQINVSIKTAKQSSFDNTINENTQKDKYLPLTAGLLRRHNAYKYLS